MIELLVEKVYVYSDDHIEIMLHYVDTPIKPKPIEYDKDTNPEGESLRGSLIVVLTGKIPRFYRGWIKIL